MAHNPSAHEGIDQPRKHCASCKKEKFFSEFHNSTITRDGKQYRCKSCDVRRQQNSPQYAHSTRKLAGIDISPVEWDTLFDNQEHRCALCGASLQAPLWHTCTLVGMFENGQMHNTDHDHITGRVRGILCQWCNIALVTSIEKIGHEGIKKILAYLGWQDHE